MELFRLWRKWRTDQTEICSKSSWKNQIYTREGPKLGKCHLCTDRTITRRFKLWFGKVFEGNHARGGTCVYIFDPLCFSSKIMITCLNWSRFEVSSGLKMQFKPVIIFPEKNRVDQKHNRLVDQTVYNRVISNYERVGILIHFVMSGKQVMWQLCTWLKTSQFQTRIFSNTLKLDQNHPVTWLGFST